MTLPFRRRHHDDEASHDRARALVSASFVEPLSGPDSAWLETHLGRCPECRAERDALIADRALLRGLRDRMPAPPRDLWARTAAAIDRQRRPGHRPLRRLSAFPLGAASVALVVLVVVATSLLPGRAITPMPGTSASDGVARASSAPRATPFRIEADRVAWVRAAPDGTYALVFATVDHACPSDGAACAPLADSSPAPLELAAPPKAVVLSPGQNQVAIVGSTIGTPGIVTIVTVPTPRPVATPASPASSTTPSSSPSSTPGGGPSVPPATPEPTATAVGSPTATGSSVPLATSSAGPGAGQVIARDVAVVGAVGYSSDGQWLAFSARPLDGTRGPDLYLWRAGDAEASRITDDGATFFSGWFGQLIVASRVGGAALLDDGQSPAPGGVSVSPTPGIELSTLDANSPAPSDAGASASPFAGEAHPMSFLIDPLTGERAAFGGLDVWMPSIDPTGRFVTYWAGTVAPADPTAAPPFEAGTVAAWRPASGHLVLDGWSAPLAPLPSPVASAEPGGGESGGPTGPSVDRPAAAARTPPARAAKPAATALPGETGSTASPADESAPPVLGPAGTPIELAPGPIADFDARFDPTGTRLAIWVLDSPDASAGRLWLRVLDAAAGTVNVALDPMGAPGVQALHGFSIDSGRLGWVTPAGQDGQPSTVQVLAWNGDDFGQVQSVPGESVQLVR